MNKKDVVTIAAAILQAADGELDAERAVNYAMKMYNLADDAARRELYGI